MTPTSFQTTRMSLRPAALIMYLKGFKCPCRFRPYPCPDPASLKPPMKYSPNLVIDINHPFLSESQTHRSETQLTPPITIRQLPRFAGKEPSQMKIRTNIKAGTETSPFVD